MAKTEYKFGTATDTKVAPDLVDPKVYGNHNSYVSGLDGLRYWWFETEEGRQQFQNAVDNGFFQRTHK